MRYDASKYAKCNVKTGSSSSETSEEEEEEEEEEEDEDSSENEKKKAAAKHKGFSGVKTLARVSSTLYIVQCTRYT